MEPVIVTITARNLVGKRIMTNFADNHTPALWHSFMPLRQSIGRCSNELFSVALYPDGFFDTLNPTAMFEKWAAAEVAAFDAVPENMESLVIPAGQYAVFRYKGSSDDAAKIFRHIFEDWMPRSQYQLDSRPHFEILGEQYKNGDPESEEDIYIPVKRVSE